MAGRKNVPQGTLDLPVTPGSLFPALQRLEECGWVSGTWGISQNNRKAKYYSITASGRRQLVEEQAHWNTVTLAVAHVLERA